MTNIEQPKKTFKKTLSGVVVSATNDKTIVVSVQRRFKHKRYSKYIHKVKKYHAHDEKNAAQVGEKVTIIESRPYSKLKRWEIFVSQAV